MTSGRQNAVDDLRAELLRSMELLLSGRTNPTLLKVLRAHWPWLKRAFVVYWIPEQGEDIYWVLVDSDQVAVVEVPRVVGVDSSKIPVKTESVHNLRQGRLPVESRRRLNAALELIREGSG